MSEVSGSDQGLNLTSATAQLAERWNARGPEADDDAGNDAGRQELDSSRADLDNQERSEDDELRDALLSKDDDAGATDEERPEGGPDDEQQTDSATLESLDFDTIAADYGIDKNQLMQVLRHSVRSGDDEREVGMHELVMGYQRGREHETAMQTLTREREAFNADVQARTQRLDAVETQVNAALQMAASQQQLEIDAVNQQYSTVDWAQLRISNPAEFAARRQEYESALRGAAERRQQTEHQIATTVHELNAARETQRKEAIERGQRELPKLIPSWSDPKVAHAEGTELSAYLAAEFGASDEDVQSILDPRALRLAYDSWQLHKLRAAAAEARENNRAGGAKPAQPGRQQSPQFRRRRAQARRVNDADQRLRETGRQEDATAALSQRWANR